MATELRITYNHGPPPALGDLMNTLKEHEVELRPAAATSKTGDCLNQGPPLPPQRGITGAIGKKENTSVWYSKFPPPQPLSAAAYLECI